MLSPIQLIEHKILRIEFDTRNIKEKPVPLAFRHAISVTEPQDDETRWLARLDLQFMPENEESAGPYIGEIAVVGIFSLADDFPKEQSSHMVYMNGGAILFGTMRELLYSITARAIHGPITLPTVDARCFLPESSQALEEHKDAPPEN